MKLPKMLFVKMESPDGEPYPNASVDIDALVDTGDTEKIGRYELVETFTASGVVQLRKLK